jgi:hypothetical protein
MQLRYEHVHCVCVCACVRACVRVCVCVCVYVGVWVGVCDCCFFFSLCTCDLLCYVCGPG